MLSYPLPPNILSIHTEQTAKSTNYSFDFITKRIYVFPSSSSKASSAIAA